MKTKKPLPIIEVSFEDLSSYESNEQSDSHDSSENDEDFPAYVFARKKSKRTKTGRNRQKRIGQRYNTETSPVGIRRDLASGCCHRNCLKELSDTTILRCRQEFHSKSNRGQSEFIVQQIKLTHVYDQPDANVTLAVNGKAVCVEGWRKVYSIKKRRYFLIKRKVVEYETVTFEDPRTGQLYSSQKLLGAHQFLTEYAKQFGEDQPDSSDVHLPSCVTKASVYEDYQLQSQTNSKPYIKISRFYEMWNSEFQHVKLRKFQTFTQCIECTNFKTALLKKPSKEEKKKIVEMRTAHLDLQRLCRQKYYKHNNKALEDPDQYLSLIIDGMDQAKTNLPRFHNVTKADCKLSKMHHHLTGVLCNSGVLHPYAFTWTDQFAPDSDVTINCFMRVLDDISTKRNGSLPPTLYVQADNCAKDNKNNYVLMFLCQLVKAKIFKKVKMSFLMVGHTHEDIDQMFSRISSKLNRTNAQTLPKLHQAIQESFQPKPAVEHLQSLWHFKGQYQGLPKLTGIKCPHVFKFKLGPDDQVHASIKDWPLSEEEYRTIVVPHIPDFPNVLDVIEPRREKVLPILRSLQQDIPKYQSAGRLAEDDALWWTRYLEGIELNERRVPLIPLPSVLPKFREDVRARPSIIDSSLRDAINQQILKLQHVSVLTLSRQRISL